MRDWRVVTEADRERWGEFVYNHPHGNIFQTPEMYEVYKNTAHLRPVVLAAVDDRKDILGVLLAVIQREFDGPLGKTTARAVVWGGPLIKDGSDADMVICLLKILDEALKGEVVYIQFRNLHDISPWRNHFTDNGYEYEEHLNFLTDLSMGEEDLWKQLRPSRRNEIRNARNKNVRVRSISSGADIEKSYNILKEVYRKIRLPLADKSFFESMYRVLCLRSMIKIFLAEYEGKIIGALYLLVFGEKLYVLYSGSYSDFYDKYPNDILYWEAMRWGCRKGYKVFDFGGAGNPDKEYGVRNFKKAFGGDLVNYGRFEKIYAPFTFRMAKTGLAVWQRLRRS